MSKILLDTICDKCGHRETDGWYTLEERDDIINKEVGCGVCEDTDSIIYIVIGVPQFELKKGCGGYYDSGKF